MINQNLQSWSYKCKTTHKAQQGIRKKNVILELLAQEFKSTNI